MASGLVKTTAQRVKPILSLDQTEARRRALNLYKAWYRQMPTIVKQYDIPVTAEQGRAKLREEFVKNRHVRDIRTIDLLVIKGQMELVETLKIFKQKSHVMAYFKDTVNPKPTDFMSKFLSGQ
ncbi:NADH dehydrogenase [ubiquinone] 1 alpha subcomplex subunit 6-like [Ornithodoros turicata]